ncbi:transporter, MotA/TolQ/ExbB proton channel family protein [Bacteriovorax sp. BSW11_IV]|uniref:MotA/TolQ/ExbB proton channel family protein n=1 Tax=Bacteriovorax sp. BSW11_IV TaxID=1353529 RepID=UPI00038A3FFB|nr:MotA/TolQ/ExbB proton channel family protein [Bacteriovorax sp. BSW11_IV]EQC43068.1 transporter, MotA/TolQ/ExbB proton channel family protein [Bacteriovorax sp. BSW11_IV]
MENEIAQVATDKSFLQSLALFMDEGGIFMWIIFVVWALGIAVAVERLKSLISYDLDGNKLMGLIKKNVLSNNVKEAIQVCSNSNALLPQVLRSGLKRANQDKDQIRDAIDATIMEMAPKVEKRMNYLSLAANVSTLIGLLGTIQGLIESFAAVAGADPSMKAKLLALGISKAMNTTALGLISAISILVIHSFLTSKGEKILNDMEQYSIKIVDLLGTQKKAS